MKNPRIKLKSCPRDEGSVLVEFQSNNEAFKNVPILAISLSPEERIKLAHRLLYPENELIMSTLEKGEL